MDIPTDLKNNLIADVENICEMDLPSATRISLERAFEITIGTYTLTNTTKIAKKLNKLIIGDVSNLLFCGICEEENEHRILPDGSLECEGCGNIAKL